MPLSPAVFCYAAMSYTVASSRVKPLRDVESCLVSYGFVPPLGVVVSGHASPLSPVMSNLSVPLSEVESCRVEPLRLV